MSSTTETGLYQRRGYKNDAFNGGDNKATNDATKLIRPPWKRVIPEENLMTLGTLRFGIRVSNSLDNTSRSSSTTTSNDPSECCCSGSFSRPSRLPLAATIHTAGSKNRTTSLGASPRTHTNSLVPSHQREASPNVCCYSKSLLLQQSSKLSQSCSSGSTCCKGQRVHQSVDHQRSSDEKNNKFNCDSSGNSNNNNNNFKSKINNNNNNDSNVEVKKKKSERDRVKSDPTLGGSALARVGGTDDDRQVSHCIDGEDQKYEDRKKSHKDKKLLISNSNGHSSSRSGSSSSNVKNRTIPTLSEESNYLKCCSQSSGSVNKVNHLLLQNNKTQQPDNQRENGKPLGLFNCFAAASKRDSNHFSDPTQNENAQLILNCDSGNSKYIRSLIAPAAGGNSFNKNVANNNSSTNKNKNENNKLPIQNSNKENKHHLNKCNTDSPLGPAKFTTSADTDFTYIDSSSCDTSTISSSDEIGRQSKRTFLHTVPTVYSPYLKETTSQINENEKKLKENSELIEFYEQKSPTLSKNYSKLKRDDVYPSENENVPFQGKILRYHSLPEGTVSTKEYFGSRNYPEIYSRISKGTIMEKRRTLERFQKLGFGRRAASTEAKPSKTEKLKELTELLKGSRNTASPTTAPPPVPPPLPPPFPPPIPLRFKRKQRILDTQSSFGSESDASIPETPEKPPEKSLLRPIVSTSNLEVMDRKKFMRSDTSKSTDCLPDDELFTKVVRPESKQIIGSYTQSTIPFRSASFSQADSPYKYKPDDSKRVDKGTDTNRYPEISQVSLNIAPDGRLENIEKAVEAMEAEVKRNSDIEPIELKLKQASEMMLEPLVEEEAPLTPTSTDLQQATTCVIPIPVFDTVVKEWSTTSPSEQWINPEVKSEIEKCDTEEGRIEADLPSSPPDTQYPIEMSAPCPKYRPESLQLDQISDVPEQEVQSPVRKRQSHNELEVPSENDEKRRIDKSKRRKGIYIQWPAASEKSQEPHESTAEDKPPWTEIAPEVFSNFSDLSKIISDDRKVSDCNSMSSGEPSTPDVEKSKPTFRTNTRSSLAYQSSDEKDDVSEMSTPPLRQFRNLFIRGDSVSDNECDRRERASASPAPEGDLKRYSKRPLRGPYGQMLEAEMKKPSPKVHYEEILEELNKSEQHLAAKSRGLSSYSFDESSIPHFQKQKTRKTNAYLPVPSHTRTASSPSQLLEVKDQPRSQSSFDNYEPIDKTHKKLTVDCDKPKRTASDTSDKHSKRSSSSASDKSQRRYDDAHYSSRTPSERSFVLHTPETPKSGPIASPELLAELLKGSSEKLVAEQHQLNTTASNQVTAGDCDLPPTILKYMNEYDSESRARIMLELYEREGSYVDCLQTIVSKYLNPLKQPENSNMIDASTVDEIFFMVPQILQMHDRFLVEMKRRFEAWNECQKIGDAFVEVFSSTSTLDTYTSFINNWTKAKTAIQVTRTQRPQFSKFLCSMTREHKSRLPLDNLLIMPIQKFPHYELLFKRLLKDTDVDHPDYKPLQEVVKLIHDILLHLNSKESEALENGQREATLRELEGVIEGMKDDLVTSDRNFLLFDLVTMPTTGAATRKERGFFLFNDLLVVTSIKRRGGTIRKPAVTCPVSVASTLDSNKYKYITKISLDDLEIVKSKDDNVRRMMKEIEDLSEDGNKLQQMAELAISLKCPHQTLDDIIREHQRDIQRQLTERQSNESQLSLMEFTLNSPNGGNMAVVFSKPEKRTLWEETITEAKQKLAANVENCPIPEFLSPIPIRKTRAGLQFTCAAPTLGIQRDVWVCNSDGYVGQVCILSLQPEPTVTSCNGVCNGKITCISSVPANVESKSICISVEDTHVSSVNYSISTATTINTIATNRRSTETNLEKLAALGQDNSPVHLDSSTSSDESDGGAPGPNDRPLVPHHRHQDSGSTCNDEIEPQQPTIWLGTEEGEIYIYNCTENIRIKKNKTKIAQLGVVRVILYYDNRVFVALGSGCMLIYTRDNSSNIGWNVTSPISVTLGSLVFPVVDLLNVHGKIWCAKQGEIKILNTNTYEVDHQIPIADDKVVTGMALLGNCVWAAVHNSAHIKCFHSTSYELIFEVNIAPSVNKMLSNCDDIIRQHKAACLRVTSILACKDLIWVGTSAGVILTIPAQGVNINSPIPSVTGIPHGHTGHVRFLTCVETEYPDENSSSNNNSGSNNKKLSNQTKRSSVHMLKKSDGTRVLVVSGGDGYEDFRSSAANTLSEVAGREDSTNHLLLWQV